MTNEEILKSKSLYRTNPLTGERGYTLACILLFGKDELISSVCPHHRTDCLKRVHDIERYDDRDNIRTNLIDTYFRMMEFVNKHLDDKFALDENTIRFSVRNRLFREAVVNNIIHREFRSNYVSRMIIEKDKVLFENGCIQYTVGQITPENVEPRPRNSMIAQVFNEMGLADELGSGIRNMYKYSKQYSENTPTLIDGDKFITLIPLVTQEKLDNIQNTNIKKIIEYLEEHEIITSKIACDLLNLKRSQVKEIFNQMIEHNIIHRYGENRFTYYSLNKLK